MKRFLGRLWPRGLVGQTVLILIIALLSAQIVGAIILRGETRSIYRGAESRFIADRVTPIVELLRETPPGVRGRIAETFDNRWLRIWLSDGPAVPGGDAGDDETQARSRELVQRLAEELENTDSTRIHVMMRPRDGARPGPWTRVHEMMHGMGHVPHDLEHAGVLVSLPLNDGNWFNAALRTRPPRRLISPDSWISFGIAAIVIGVIAVVALRRIARPLGQLTEAAGKLGRGERTAPLTEEGPADVRDTIRAFNDMQDRLRRFVADRTRMMAAISHDLRTPITSLRLRVEMLEDAEQRERMIATLDEMQKMVEASLAFAREEASDEDTRLTDLAALVNGIADDCQDMGLDVTVSEAQRTPYPCRPVALTRALRNLIENGARYGGKARVFLSDNSDGIVIRIDDDGPGIPNDDLERVFEPFVRLEESRSTETGGIGLGMAIARDIVRRHGGDIRLSNRPEGGLSAEVTLPAAG